MYGFQVWYVDSLRLTMEILQFPLHNKMSPLQQKSLFQEAVGIECIASYNWFIFFRLSLEI